MKICNIFIRLVPGMDMNNVIISSGGISIIMTSFSYGKREIGIE